MFCTQCGHGLPPGGRFCERCGAPQEAETFVAAAAVGSPVYQPPFCAQPQPVYARPQPAARPVPPSMHWVLVLILTCVTGGLFLLAWSLKQAVFVKKIDPSSKARMLMCTAVLAILCQIVLFVLALASGSQGAVLAAMGILMLLNVVIVVAWLMAVFAMRGSLVRYYNAAEPIGLRLSGAMTFFFNALYFQYHFSRIADWKRGGRLS